MFYTYLYLRDDNSPYYVGKGKGRRAHKIEKNHYPPKDPSKIVVQHWIDEDTALAYERYQIDFWGRKDIGTGILRNLTDGGENPPKPNGRKWTEEHRQLQSRRLMGVGVPSTPEQREEQRLARLGSHPSEEAREKMSEAQKRRHANTPIKHGTSCGYSKKKCRCTLCKAFERNRKREQRLRNKSKTF